MTRYVHTTVDFGAVRPCSHGLDQSDPQEHWIKRHGKKEYRYHYLKFRDGTRVVNQHVSGDAVKELQDKLALRKKYVSEAKSYEKRISYVDRILEKGERQWRSRRPIGRFSLSLSPICCRHSRT